MTEIVGQMSATNQVVFLAKVNEAIGKMPGSPEEKAAAYVNANAAALAGAPKLAPGLFDSAKLALAGLAAGEYETLSGQLPFSGDAPDASQATNT